MSRAGSRIRNPEKSGNPGSEIRIPQSPAGEAGDPGFREIAALREYLAAHCVGQHGARLALADLALRLAEWEGWPPARRPGQAPAPIDPDRLALLLNAAGHAVATCTVAGAPLLYAEAVRWRDPRDGKPGGPALVYDANAGVPAILEGRS